MGPLFIGRVFYSTQFSPGIYLAIVFTKRVKKLRIHFHARV